MVRSSVPSIGVVLRERDAGFFQPGCALWIACEVQKPLHKREPVIIRQAEPGGMRRKRVGDCVWVIVDLTESISHDMRHGLWILPVRKKICCGSCWPGDQKTS
jgi:hypothetical protein